MSNDLLKLENQLCFPLYSAAKEITRRYRPLLDTLGLTYTQYICMMVLWEHESATVGKIGELLYLDSGTLTPMLKKMESAGLITRKRSPEDERVVVITITRKGMDLKEKAADIPMKMAGCVQLSLEEAIELRKLLGKIMQG